MICCPSHFISVSDFNPPTQVHDSSNGLLQQTCTGLSCCRLLFKQSSGVLDDTFVIHHIQCILSLEPVDSYVSLWKGKKGFVFVCVRVNLLTSVHVLALLNLDLKSQSSLSLVDVVFRVLGSEDGLYIGQAESSLSIRGKFLITKDVGSLPPCLHSSFLSQNKFSLPVH